MEKLVDVRRKKNVTPDMARDFLHDPNYFGTVTALLSKNTPLRSNIVLETAQLHARIAVQCIHRW